MLEEMTARFAWAARKPESAFESATVPSMAAVPSQPAVDGDAADAARPHRRVARARIGGKAPLALGDGAGDGADHALDGGATGAERHLVGGGSFGKPGGDRRQLGANTRRHVL